MKKILFFLAVLAAPYILTAQYTTNPTSTGFNNDSFSTCGTNQFCDYNYIGGEIKMYIDRIVGNTAYFRVVKCAATAIPFNVPTFSTTGYVFIKSGSLCSNIEGQAVVNGTTTYSEIVVTLAPNQSLKNYYAVYIPNYNPSNPYGSYARYGSGAIQITGSGTNSSNLYMYENISFSNSSMDVYENNAFTFKIANSGSVTWNGSIYLVFSSGTTIDLGSWSVQPGYVNYCVSCYFVPGVNDIGTINAEVRYQTNGIGSSIRVASQINGYVNVRPLAPILTSPTSGASISTGSNIGFTWNTNGNPSGVSYNLRIRNTSDNVVIFDQSVGSVSSYFLTSSNFTVGKNYQWIVTAVKGSVVQESFPANSFSIVGQPNITMGNNVTFGTTTLYSGVNYTGTFSITNNGSAPWSGSMYVILSTGASLDGGSATINAGTTRNYSVSYTPNITASNVGVAASYQTGGTGSGITVPNQNASNINIIGNLGITGNTVSPSTGNQNSTNFTFTANLSNVAPSPTLAPTVDIEFRAPDGLTYTTTNIPNIGGTTYSKTQTLQQVGTYEYRYISYQSTRPNAFTAWQSLSVSNPQSVNVTSPALNSTHTVGNNLPIAYAFTGYTGNVSIELTQGTTGTTAFRVIADPTTNLTGFSYQIPLDVPAGQYRVKVYNTGSGSVTNYSQVFTIVGQSVNVTSPALNSTHTVGNNLPIAYAFTGYTGNVSIELTQGTTGTTAFRVIADPTTNLTGFSYQIPLDVPAGQYRVKVYNTGSGTLSSYSQVFTINALANCPVCFTNQSVANFTQTGQDGFCAAQYLCSKGIIQNTQPNPSLAINREDVAKIVLLGLLNDNRSEERRVGKEC